MAKKITKKERKAQKALERNVFNKNNIDHTEGKVTEVNSSVLEAIYNETLAVNGVDLFFTEMPDLDQLKEITKWLMAKDGLGFGRRGGSFDLNEYSNKKGWAFTWMSGTTIQLNPIEGILRLRNIFRDTRGYDGCEFYCKADEAKAFFEMMKTA